MIDLSTLFQRAGKVAAENSPAILTALGVTGTLTTAYLAAKGAFKAAEMIVEEEVVNKKAHEEDPSVEYTPLTTRQKADLTWEVYIPAAITAGMTIGAIIFSNRLSERRAAAMASMYALAEKGFKEYREKNVKKIGKKKEQEVRDEIIQDRIAKSPPNDLILALAAQKNSTACWDKWSDRYFVSDMESIRKAVNDFNHELLNSTHLSLSEFYYHIGLNPTPGSDEVGWDSNDKLELNYTSALHDGTPVLAIDFNVRPNHRYSQLY